MKVGHPGGYIQSYLYPMVELSDQNDKTMIIPSMPRQALGFVQQQSLKFTTVNVLGHKMHLASTMRECSIGSTVTYPVILRKYSDKAKNLFIAHRKSRARASSITTYILMI